MPQLSEVEPLTWPQFLEFVRDNWEQGEHWIISAPTGEAKTTFMGGLARTRRFVMAMDVKGGDRTLAQLGYPRVTKYPLPRELRDKIRDREPCRFIVGSTARDPAGKQTRYALVRRYMDMAYQEGNWTVLVPDLKIVVKLAAAGDQIEELLMLARDAGTSFVADAQRLSGITREAQDQPTYVAVGYTMHEDTVDMMAEAMGRSKAELRGAMRALRELRYGYLIVCRRPRQPILLTRPEKL